MKKILFVMSLAFFLCLNISKAEESQAKTLFDSEEFRSGFYGGPELKVGNMNNSLGLMVGGRLGWIVNSTISIGLAGYGLTTSHEVEGYTHPLYDANTRWYLRTGYGGLFLEYINNSNELVHLTLNTLIGVGGAAYTQSYHSIPGNDHDWDEWENDNWTAESSPYFIVEPGLTAEVNLTRWMRIAAGVNYRFVSYLDLPNTKNEDLSGMTGTLTFKFGKF